MALIFLHKGTEFGVGDKIKVSQKIKEGDKHRIQSFEGIVIGLKGREENKSFTVRRIGAQQVGIERIFPLNSPTLEKVEVMRKGVKGVKRAKLYYIREKSKREIEQIYFRASRKDPNVKPVKRTGERKKKSSSKKTSKK